jgi:hypothetical protein
MSIMRYGVYKKPHFTLPETLESIPYTYVMYLHIKVVLFYLPGLPTWLQPCRLSN